MSHVAVTTSFSFDLRHYFMLSHPPFSSSPHHHADGIRTQMALISDSCPEKVWRQVPSRTSHSLAVASQAPEMNSLKSGETAKLIQSPVWPRNTVFCCPVSMSQSALWQRRELLRARTTLSDGMRNCPTHKQEEGSHGPGCHVGRWTKIYRRKYVHGCCCSYLNPSRVRLRLRGCVWSDRVPITATAEGDAERR